MFPLNGDMENPNVYQTEGVLDLYKENIQKIRLQGPTYFAPCIEELVRIVTPEFKKGNYQYYTLLILTDGTICDIKKTFRAIEKAAKLPISLIIIGLGEENFAQMDILDGDSKLEDGEENDFRPVRDIVQFVSFRSFKNDVEKLSEEVLSEIPGQVAEFYWMVTHHKDGFDEKVDQK